MPGPAISKYLTQHTDKGFNEVASVFRHDFVQFMGMVHSWVVMIDGEITTADEAAFANSDSKEQFINASLSLQRDAERIFKEAQTHLRPEIHPPESNPEDVVDHLSHILHTWDYFYHDFGSYATNELIPLENQMRQFVSYTEFEILIEKPLSPMAQGDSIRALLLRPFERIRDLLNPDKFDARIAQALGEKHP